VALVDRADHERQRRAGALRELTGVGRRRQTLLGGEGRTDRLHVL
jgi:hypothetical protein